MSETLKRTRYGAVDYGSQKEVCKKASKAGRRFERKKTEEMQKKFLAARKRREAIKIRKMFYDETDRSGSRYTPDSICRFWSAYGWTAEDVLDVIFYRTWKSLVPVE